jgi:hypothetical protein
MGKVVADAVLDAALNQIATANLMVALPSEPASFAAAQSAKLAEVAMTSGDFSISNGTVSGRRVVVAGKSGLTVTTSGTANHIALLNTATSALLYVTTAPSEVLTSGGTLNIASWQAEIADPV